jgi:hypothetical protein
MSDFGIGFTASDPAPVVTAIRRDLAGKMRRAINVAGRATLLETRGETKAAFPKAQWRRMLRDSLPNTWRGKLYPEAAASETLSPAYLIYSRAPEIVGAHAAGLTIVPNRGVFLAYPTVEAVGFGRRKYARQLTPKVWKAESGLSLRFVPTEYGGVLVSDHFRWKTRKNSRGKKTRWIVERREKPVVMFVLIRRSSLRARLPIKQIAQRAGGLYRNTLAAELRG